MATFTTTYNPPTIYVPANFALEISPAEAQQLITELAPVMAATSTTPFTLGNPGVAIPATQALYNALKAAAALTATSSSSGTGVPPTVTTITLPAAVA